MAKSATDLDVATVSTGDVNDAIHDMMAKSDNYSYFMTGAVSQISKSFLDGWSVKVATSNTTRVLQSTVI
jgi:hypothetical protein